MRNPETRFETRPTRPNRDFQIARNTSHPFRPFTVPNVRRVVVHRRIHPSIHASTQKKIVERESNPHLRLAKQPAGGPTEDRARGVRVELGRRPRCLFRRRSCRFLFGAHDDGGPARRGRSTGRRPRGRPHRAGLSSREAEHFRRALLRGVPTVSADGTGRRTRPIVPWVRSSVLFLELGRQTRVVHIMYG